MSVTFYGKSGSGTMTTYLHLGYEHPAHLNFNNGNARAVLGLLGLPNDECLMGECTMPEARRAIMQAKARFERRAPEHTRESYEEKRPGRARVISGGLDEEGLRSRIERFEEFVDTMARMGAETLYWS